MIILVILVSSNIIIGWFQLEVPQREGTMDHIIIISSSSVIISSSSSSSSSSSMIVIGCIVLL